MNLNNLKFLIKICFLAAATGFLIIWFGLFNISARVEHWDITSNFIEFVRERSIRSNAEAVTVPDLSDKTRVARGAANYAAMCAQCHLAPGFSSSELHEGLYPQPPVLSKPDKHEREPIETFWIIKNGLKMTAMPAWGIYNSDEQIWDLIALIEALKDMSSDEYQKLVAAGEHTHAKGRHAGENDSGSEKMIHTNLLHAPDE